MSAAGVGIELRGVAQRFHTRPVLQGLDLQVDAGDFIAIVGRSGCGKSTLLRLLAGLDRPSAGEVRVGAREAASVKAQARFMFQDARLLPWKSVLDNVALGLSGEQAREQARRSLAEVGLADRAGDWPAVLSGGQRQRVALARALVHRPRLLLLDEPLGALDALTRIEMQGLIERLWREHRFTAVLVTHDVAEAVALADRILLLEAQGDRGAAVVLDEPVPLARSRSRGAQAFAEIEERVLARVLSRAPADARHLPIREPADPRVAVWRFAV
jgi:sulfonate transport system ATP-binding protein